MTKRRTSINIKLQPEEFSKLLDAMKTASPDSPTTPGAFLKWAALDYCENHSTSPVAPRDSEPTGTDVTETTPQAHAASPHPPANEDLFPMKTQTQQTADDPSRETASPASPGRHSVTEENAGTPGEPQLLATLQEMDSENTPDLPPPQAAGAEPESATPDVSAKTPAQDPGPNEREPVDFLGLLPFPPPSTADDPASTTTTNRPPGISPEVAENLGEVRQIFVSELDQVRRFVSSLYIQANDTLDWLHENFRKCMRENVDTLEDARQRVKESVTGLTTGFLSALEQASNLLEQASERHAQELQRRVETLDQIPGQLQKSSDEILAAFRKHARESTETLTKVSTAALRVAEKLQAENFRVGLRTFLAAIAAAALIGLPAFGWLAWQNSRLETSADTWRANAERINQYVVETLYPLMTEKERTKTNEFYARHRLPTPEEQSRARAE